MNQTQSGLYFMHISVHGLLRGFDLELGRDADTGGQIKYVVELARALSQDKRVDRVDLLTRRIIARGVDPSYAEPVEELGPKAKIIRLQCGPRRYLRKERLWPYLDNFVDQALSHIRTLERIPDVIHAHYADAGYVGAQLARLLGVPFFFTGHSLGRVKRERMLLNGGSPDSLEKRFSFNTRIEAEETALDTAAKVIVSTHQEIEQQYAMYDNYPPKRMVVIPPGVDLAKFSPPQGDEWESPIGKDLSRFLADRNKPMILAIARPDERKNLPTLVEAFGRSKILREKANLVIIAGNRDKLQDLAPGARKVLRTIMLQIDQHDLYGSVAYPKFHSPEDVPVAYRLAAATRGVFVNPALTEPIGLTLIEAAASGLPVIATDDGGPRDIIGTCRNGRLIDPMDVDALSAVLENAVTDDAQWSRWSADGLKESHQAYSWQAHVRRYMEQVEQTLQVYRSDFNVFDYPGTRLPAVDRLLITNVDDTLTGDKEALRKFIARLRRAGNSVGFGLASGSPVDRVLRLLQEHEIPVPDFLITSAGTEIFYGKNLVRDRAWQRHIHFRWEPDKINAAMDQLSGLKKQETSEQSRFKFSYIRESDDAPSKDEVLKHLRNNGVRANVILSFGRLIDVLPIRASTGLAIRHLMIKWQLDPEHMLAVGSSGNEEMMLSGDILGVVVGHFSPEIEYLQGRPRIYFTAKQHAYGVLDGISHYDFFGDISVPDEDEPASSALEEEQQAANP